MNGVRVLGRRSWAVRGLGAGLAVGTCMRLLPALFLVACGFDATPSEPFDVEPTLPPTDTATPVLPEDAWLGVTGNAVIDDGGAWLGGQIVASVYSRDPATSETERVCQVTSEIVGPLAVASAPAGDTEVYGLWTAPLAPTACPGVPDEIVLGIGPLPSVLWPAAEEAHASPRLTRGLYGLDRGELVVFGLAGTAEQRAGVGTPASLVPVPAGDYELSGAYLLPL